MRTGRPGERVFGFFMFALAIGLLHQAYGISALSGLATPGAFPLAAAAVMTVAAIAVLWGNRRLVVGEGHWGEVLPIKAIGLFVLLAVFAANLRPLGFLPAAFGFLIVAIAFLQGGGILRATGLAFVSVMAVFVVFRLIFKVILPEGIVPEREILAWLGL